MGELECRVSVPLKGSNRAGDTEDPGKKGSVCKYMLYINYKLNLCHTSVDCHRSVLSILPKIPRFSRTDGQISPNCWILMDDSSLKFLA